jgi:hypothetical protein
MLSIVCLRPKNVLMLTTILFLLSACNLNSSNLQLSFLDKFRQAPAIKNGFVQEYYTSGKVKHTGRYINNLPVGLHRYFTPQGNLVSEKVFVDGKLNDYKLYKQLVPFAKAKYLPVSRAGYLKYKDGLKPMQEAVLPDNLLRVRRNAGFIEVYITSKGGYKLLSKKQIGALANKADI